MKDIYIYGAKSTALGVYRAIDAFYPENRISGFVVTSLEGNPKLLAGLPVKELHEVSEKDVHILIAVPESLHEEIRNLLYETGFESYTCIDSVKEAELMRRYYSSLELFPSVRDLKKSVSRNADELSQTGSTDSGIKVYTAKFHRDVPLHKEYEFPKWAAPLQVGAALTDRRVAELTDDTGDNISFKNPNYCEITGLYWLWKNELSGESPAEYYGLFHYRRLLELADDDIAAIKDNNIDVVLPYPMLHEPGAWEHHTRYVRESDWEAMMKALKELQPEYASAADKSFDKPYFYNYNMLIARRTVLEDYCKWLFPILQRTEELSEPKGGERADRYIGYLAESLMTLYFMYHKDDLKIAHTARLMLV